VIDHIVSTNSVSLEEHIEPSIMSHFYRVGLLIEGCSGRHQNSYNFTLRKYVVAAAKGCFKIEHGIGSVFIVSEVTSKTPLTIRHTLKPCVLDGTNIISFEEVFVD